MTVTSVFSQLLSIVKTTSTYTALVPPLYGKGGVFHMQVPRKAGDVTALPRGLLCPSLPLGVSAISMLTLNLSLVRSLAFPETFPHVLIHSFTSLDVMLPSWLHWFVHPELSAVLFVSFSFDRFFVVLT